MLPPFDPMSAPKSTKLHFDYTGPLPQRCSSGTLYFMVSCWGCYINIQPLTALKGAQTAEALVKAVQFFRSKGITLDETRMDNQTSPELRAAAIKLGLTKNLVPSKQKRAIDRNEPFRRQKTTSLPPELASTATALTPSWTKWYTRWKSR